MKQGGFWLLIGLGLGLSAGLTYAWLIDPVQYYDTTPPMLRMDYQEKWIRLSVLAYSIEGDAERTRLRLKNLPEATVQRVLRQTFEDAVRNGRPLPMLKRMAALAQDYGIDTAAVRIYTDANELRLTLQPTDKPETPAPSPTSLPTETPTFTPTPVPTFTPTPTPLPAPTDAPAQSHPYARLHGALSACQARARLCSAAPYHDHSGRGYHAHCGGT